MGHSHQHKVYLPTSARTNQYLTADIKVTPELLAHYESAEDFYQKLSQLVFTHAEAQELHNCQVIANDKLPVVRYHTEACRFQTNEKIVFFYNPAYHEAQNLFTDENHIARKFRIVFLATGEDIRANSAVFHAKVIRCLELLRPELPEMELTVKVRDHQHLSYDLFAKKKGHKEQYGYKLRAIDDRYKSRNHPLPQEHSSLAYVTVDFPLTRKIKSELVTSTGNYSDLYKTIEDAFLIAATANSLTRIAMIANGLTPLVRNSKFELLEQTEESQMIGFDPDSTEQQYIRHWHDDKIVEAVSFTIAAGKLDCDHQGYGRFMNKVESVFKSLAKSLNFDGSHDDFIVRVHQHISYQK
ncbi:MAG: DUF3083 family protein [Shewanella sp.]|nr:DUF3083 family protein [Shewanella sp.]